MHGFYIAYHHFFPVLTVNYVVQDGKSNWLEGFILMGMFILPTRDCSRLTCLLGLYLILAVTFWYYPGSGMLTKNIFPIVINPNDSWPFSSCLSVYLTYILYYTFIILESQFTSFIIVLFKALPLFDIDSMSEKSKLASQKL
jgi:hypothetical protein